MAVRIYRNGQWNNITAQSAIEDANRIAIGATDETIDPSKIYYPSFVDVNNPSNARDYEPLYTGAGITFAPGGVGSLGGGDLAICGNLHLKGTSGIHDGDIFSAGGSDGHFGIYNTSSGFLVLKVLDTNGNNVGISSFMVQDGSDNPGKKSYFKSNVSPVDHNSYNLGESSAHQWNNVYANKFYGDGSNLTCVGGATAWQPDAQENLYAGTLAGNAFDADTCCNIAVGYYAGCSTQSTGSNADNNIFLGSKSGLSNTISGNNIFLGQCAGYCNNNGAGSNVAIGRRAFYSNTTGSHNVAIGCRAGYNLGTGMYNLFLGRQAGHCQTSGDYNIAIGNKAQLECLTGQNQLVIASSESAYWLRGDCNSNVQLGAGLKDCDSCLGTSGQFLSSTGSHLKWETVVSTSDNACKILTVDRPIACTSDHFLTFVATNTDTSPGSFESLYTNPQVKYNPNTCTICVHNLYAHKCVTVSCALCSNGNTILGDSSADNVTFNAKVSSSILPTVCACSDSDPLGKDLGSTSFLWRNIYARNFVGQITGNADSATCVYSTETDTNTLSYLSFVEGTASGLKNLRHDDQLTYKPDTNLLTVEKIKPTQIVDSSNGTGTQDYVIKANGSGGWTWGQVDSGSVGTLNFTDLDDTPVNYTSSANKLVAVNSGASGLEFISASSVGTDTFVTGASFTSITGGARLTLTRNNSQADLEADLTISTLGGVEDFTDLNDTPGNYTSSASKLVAVNASANALEFINASTAGAQKFTDLTDTPVSIANPGDDGKVVKVSSGALVFDTVSGLGGVTDVTVVQTGRSAPCALPITVSQPSTGTKQINIPSSSNAFGARFVQNSSPSNPCDGDIWFDTSTTGGGSFTTDKIIEGDTKAEVVDAGTNGHFLVETDGTEQLRITHNGIVNMGRAVTNDPILATGNVNSGIKLLGSTGTAGDGFGLTANAKDIVAIFNRTNTTGRILEYKYDATVIGSVQTDGTNLEIKADNNLILDVGGGDKFQIGSSGQFGIGGANYGTPGQVLTSGGASAAPTWGSGGGSTPAKSGFAANYTQTFYSGSSYGGNNYGTHISCTLTPSNSNNRVVIMASFQIKKTGTQNNNQYARAKITGGVSTADIEIVRTNSTSFIDSTNQFKLIAFDAGANTSTRTYNLGVNSTQGGVAIRHASIVAIELSS